MQRLLQTFATKITPAQSMKMFTAAKSPKRSWAEHYLYLVAVSEACGGADNLVLDNIAHYADPATGVSMLSRLNLTRTDHLRQAEELTHFTQSTEIELRGKTLGKDVVNNVASDLEEKRKCFKYGEVGYLKAVCPPRKKKTDVDFTLAVGDSGVIKDDHWILDSGSSRHLVNDVSLLEDVEDFTSEYTTAAKDGDTLRASKRGRVVIKADALGERRTVQLLDVQYAANLERNIILYSKLEKKGIVLSYREGRRVLVLRAGGPPIMDVVMGQLCAHYFGLHVSARVRGRVVCLNLS
ncbi:hypothetical protein PC121_g14472 [Phytophthora cactorum]|nr:hypothetical protein PC120_g13107 [Phytophthora cactorum]KAG3058257.1 hypothetical protein PC121_g14472 [Phytophthora cactorum]KAG4052075.1 hypothetical protein PC123_g12745 [Phytophthora cactorum]